MELTVPLFWTEDGVVDRTVRPVVDSNVDAVQRLLQQSARYERMALTSKNPRATRVLARCYFEHAMLLDGRGRSDEPVTR